ncbi:hypothetical protein K457DRAFT_128900 [Linnemannia elongata AG-77]|uniref:ATP-dependent DNA helicase n=1 Tax=Linnemannia elongata AG-77 TaxID=1314771 RepID=A0A197JKW1_9FUNG|nr:hypothetical protein K457DRAFT_128900 [Linnemannia elongata AG-77]
MKTNKFYPFNTTYRDLLKGLSDVANKVFQSPSDEYKPFGGAPVVFGDFVQMGPIVKEEQAAVGNRVRLRQVHRQAQDQSFVRLLDAPRDGKDQPRDIERVNDMLESRLAGDYETVVRKILKKKALFFAGTRFSVKK